MHYFIDGYNLLFALEITPHPIEKSREELISALVDDLNACKIKATLVFDSGSTHLGPFPHVHERSGVEVVFSPHGICADRYLVELLETKANIKGCVAVTDDAALRSSCLALHAKVIKCEDFLSVMRKRLKKHQPKADEPPRDPAYDEHLRKIFEDRLD